MSLTVSLKRELRDANDSTAQTYRGWELKREEEFLTIGSVLTDRSTFSVRIADVPLLIEDLAAITDKNPARIARGQKGGDARAASLTPERRSEIARAGANARWGAK